MTEPLDPPFPRLRLVAGTGFVCADRNRAGNDPAFWARPVAASDGDCALPGSGAAEDVGLLLGHRPRPRVAPSRPAGFLSRLDAPPSEAPPESDSIRDDGESHLLCIAPTGAGKGRSVLIPNLLNYPGSCIVVDPKGEAARITAGYRRSLGQRTAVIAPFDVGNTEALNPFDLFDLPDTDPVDAAYELTGLLGRGVQAESGHHLFWDVNANMLIRGVMLAIRHTLPREEHTLATLNAWLSDDDLAYRLAVFLEQHKAGAPAACVRDLCGYLHHAERVREDVLSTAMTRLDIFASAGVQRATGPSTVRLQDLLDDRPMTLYLVLPAEKLYSHGRLLRLWLAVLLGALLRRSRLPRHKTLVMIDECAALGELDSLRTLVCLMRGFGVRCAMFFQDASQLRRLYPQDWSTMINNTMVQTFGTRSMLASRELDDLLGLGDARAALRVPTGMQMLCLPGREPVVCERFDYLRDASFVGRYAPDSMRAGPQAS
ncbi:MAG: type IV secretory system conjugative DNA transfer family protein [Burkholderiaceae bacterium]|nr:type IV secretory system conjugative DNA transfer family protein [Burkholderiaceae bacterium]